VLGVRGAAEEIQALGLVDLSSTAIVAERDLPEQRAFATDGEIDLVEYAPNYLKYRYTAAEPMFAVFSEIFYDKGWSVTVDGQAAEAVRVDYILRGMQLPAGEHAVEWSFRAPNWGVVNTVTALCSLLVVAVLVFAIYKKSKE
jgi:uncharacterized membrane protein YfhO